MESPAVSEESSSHVSSRRSFSIDDLKGPTDRLSQWRRLPELTIEAVRLVWRSSPRHFVAVTALTFGSAIALGLQLVIGREVLQDLMALGQDGAESASLVPALSLLIGATVLSGLLAAFISHQQRYLTEIVGRYVYDRIIDISTKVKFEFFEEPSFHDQLARARTSGMSKPIEMVNSITGMITALLTSIGIGAALITMHAILLPLVILASIPLLLATIRNSRQAYQFEYAWTPRSRERLYMVELLTGRNSAKELRLFGTTRYLRSRYDLLTEERFNRLREFLRERLLVALGGTIGGTIGAILAIGSLVWLVSTARVDVATAIAAGVAIQLLTGRFATMTKSLGSLVEGGMFLDDYRSFIDFERDPSAMRTEDTGACRVPAMAFQGLRVENVSFTYPGGKHPVLAGVSLDVNPGEVVALVGQNGSGKTTLVHLICQLYQPDAGRILWNGQPASDVIEALRSDMTVIFQDYLKYHLSVFDNVVLGRSDRLEDSSDVSSEVVSSTRRAGAHGFVSLLPQGYDTRLGRQFYGGHELSIGQWQKLALARAFFRGGNFLVLDEPTAALDPRAEHELFQQMRTLYADRSVLLISHRFSSVRSADRIYVLEAGRITEHGSHDELMALRGHYHDLFSLQAAAYLGEQPDLTATSVPSDSDPSYT